MFFTFQNRSKPSKSDIFKMLPSWYILSLKPKGKGDFKKLIHLSSVYEFGSYIKFIAESRERRRMVECEFVCA